MINILIVDDNPKKIKVLRTIVELVPEVSLLETSTNVISAKRQLSEKHFDVLILDLGLPLRDGDDPKPENGIGFLNDISRQMRLIKPFHIIGFSAFDDYISQFKETFEKELWALLKYDEQTSNWEKLIKNTIDVLSMAKLDLKNPNHFFFQYDIAVITALRSPELDSILDLDANWQAFSIVNDASEYHRGVICYGEKKIKIIAACAPQMGMVASSTLAHKMIYNFRPKYIAITGIACGVKGNVNLGDILIADISFDSGSGKIKTNDIGDIRFEPDFKSIDIDPDLK